MKKALLCISLLASFAHIAFAAQSEEAEKREAQEAELHEMYDVDTYCGCGCNELSEDCPMRVRSSEEWHRYNDQHPTTRIQPQTDDNHYPHIIDLATSLSSLRRKKQS